jgi:hypothetical protein
MAVRNDTCNWLRTSNSMKRPASQWRSPSASVVKIGEGVDEAKPWELPDGLWQRIEPLLPLRRRRYRYHELPTA